MALIWKKKQAPRISVAFQFNIIMGQTDSLDVSMVWLSVQGEPVQPSQAYPPGLLTHEPLTSVVKGEWQEPYKATSVLQTGKQE